MRYCAREGPGHCTKRISGQQSLPVLPDLRRVSYRKWNTCLHASRSMWCRIMDVLVVKKLRFSSLYYFFLSFYNDVYGIFELGHEKNWHPRTRLTRCLYNNFCRTCTYNIIHLTLKQRTKILILRYKNCSIF